MKRFLITAALIATGAVAVAMPGPHGTSTENGAGCNAGPQAAGPAHMQQMAQMGQMQAMMQQRMQQMQGMHVPGQHRHGMQMQPAAPTAPDQGTPKSTP